MRPAVRVHGFAKRPERATAIECEAEPDVSVTEAGTVRVEITAPTGERLWLTMEAFHARSLLTRLALATTEAECR